MNFENNLIVIPEVNPRSSKATRKLCFFIHPTISLQFRFILPRNADSYRLACIEGIILTAGQIFRRTNVADGRPFSVQKKEKKILSFFFPVVTSYFPQ